MNTEHAANVAWLEGECDRIARENSDACESDIQNKLMFAIGSRPGFRVWRQNAGKFRTVSDPCDRCARKARWIQGAPGGAADISGIIPGGVRLEVEVKAKKGRHEPDQKDWQRMILSAGGIYILAKPT